MSRTAVLEAKSATPPTHPSPAGYSRLQSAAVPIFSDFEGEQTVHHNVFECVRLRCCGTRCTALRVHAAEPGKPCRQRHDLATCVPCLLQRMVRQHVLEVLQRMLLRRPGLRLLAPRADEPCACTGPPAEA
eukprot:s1433_g3.t1